MLSIDANVLVYSTDRNAPARRDAAAELLASAVRAGAGLTEQSLFEFMHAATRKAKMPLADVSAIIREWLKNFALLLPPETVVSDTLDLLSRYKLSVWDARLLVVCAANGCDYLLSEDLQDGAQYGRVAVVDPFKSANASLVSGMLRL
jgi:predicted nucleic acid-binding protein